MFLYSHLYPLFLRVGSTSLDFTSFSSWIRRFPSGSESGVRHIWLLICGIQLTCLFQGFFLGTTAETKEEQRLVQKLGTISEVCLHVEERLKVTI